MSFTEVLKNLNWSYLTDLLISVIPALVCITIHECCHGIAAYALGDETAKTDGRISLNPLHHIDPVGLLMLVLNYLIFYFSGKLVSEPSMLFRIVEAVVRTGVVAAACLLTVYYWNVSADVNNLIRKGLKMGKGKTAV